MDAKVIECHDTTIGKVLKKKDICSSPTTRDRYVFKERNRNDNFNESIIPVTWASIPSLDNGIIAEPSGLSFIHDNVVSKKPKRRGKLTSDGCIKVIKESHIATQSKWHTTMDKQTYDINTGEILASKDITTTDTIARLKARRMALKRFTEHFGKLYASKKVSMLFITFTIANQNGITLRATLDNFKKRCKRNEHECRGYFWVLEISKNMHVHYHVLAAVDRIRIQGKEMPEWLKLDGLWNASTQVEFVRNSVEGYLSKYLDKDKCQWKVIGRRMYGKSISKIQTKKK